MNTIKHLSLMALVCMTSIMQADETSRPNFLILIGDDIDRDTLGPWGGQAHTPNLDQLAKEGVRFDRAYCNVAMCAPFRQELYSGRTVWRTRAMPNHSKSVPNTRSLPHYLRPLGYRVGLLGKGHIGPRQAYPFDKVGVLSKTGETNPLATRLARKYMTAARDAGKPFCLVIAANDAHGPYTTGDPSRYDSSKFSLSADEIDTPEYRRNLAKHFAEITHLDALLGELRSVLAEEKLSNNTMVLFFSEQGNGFPFSKWTCFDDGLSTGIVAALPGVIPAGRKSGQLMWIADIAPTLIEASGGMVRQKDFDGRSQWANFKGGDQPVHSYAYGAFTNCNIIDNRERVYPIRSIRDKRYSLIWSPRHKQITSNTTLTQALELIQSGQIKGRANIASSWVLKAKRSKSTDDDRLVHRLYHRPEWALYDRKVDPEELTNLAEKAEMAPVLNKLQGELRSWLKRWDDADPVATERGFVRKR